MVPSLFSRICYRIRVVVYETICPQGQGLEHRPLFYLHRGLKEKCYPEEAVHAT